MHSKSYFILIVKSMSCPSRTDTNLASTQNLPGNISAPNDHTESATTVYISGIGSLAMGDAVLVNALYCSGITLPMNFLIVFKLLKENIDFVTTCTETGKPDHIISWGDALLIKQSRNNVVAGTGMVEATSHARIRTDTIDTKR